jgi:hypothetical protein
MVIRIISNSLSNSYPSDALLFSLRRLVLTFGHYKYPSFLVSSFHPSLFLSIRPFPILRRLSAGVNQLDAGRLVIRALALISLPSSLAWMPTIRTSLPLAFVVFRLGAWTRAGVRPSRSFTLLSHRPKALAQLIMIKTSNASRDQAFLPLFGRLSFYPEDYGVALHLPRGVRRLRPRFAA